MFLDFSVYLLLSIFFFFQAEDGIRDLIVTGVQTCALPISYAGAFALGFVEYHRFTAISYKLPLLDLMIGCALLAADANGIAGAGHVRDKIGRASCRERV